MSENTQLVSFSYLLDAAWISFKKLWLYMLKIYLWGIVIGLAALIIIGAVGLVGYFVLPSQPLVGISLLILAGAAVITGLLYLNSWIQLAQIDLISRQESGSMFQITPHRVWGLIGLALLTALVVIGGFFLLIIPGVVFIIWYSQAQFAYALENTSITQSLSISKRYVVGRWWKVLGLLIVPGLALSVASGIFDSISDVVSPDLIAIQVLLAVISAAISIVAGMYMLCYSYHLYLGLKNIPQQV